ncbi:hypothetical protein CCHR01_18836 [Colletotrichum chrysophilum]|uniref:Uncharacterized protein n=1 Tax=Colletotrichum chrysophilum TaxID=1836956 RepID=A0AAD8ZZW8_9PEZI|nr:hypothetical protein CCHR01_18836 [Colletotrichum chrysophilum]
MPAYSRSVAQESMAPRFRASLSLTSFDHITTQVAAIVDDGLSESSVLPHHAADLHLAGSVPVPAVAPTAARTSLPPREPPFLDLSENDEGPDISGATGLRFGRL